MRLVLLLTSLLGLAARIFSYLEHRAALSGADRAAIAGQALRIARQAGAARRIDETIEAMTDDEVRDRLQGDFRR